MNFHKTLLVGLALVLCAAQTAVAQRTYTFSFETNVTAAADTNPTFGEGGNLFPVNTGNKFTYGVYPTLRLNSLGKSSVLDFYVGYGLNKVTGTDLALDSNSVVAGGSFETTLGRNWHLTFDEVFKRSPDFSSLDLFRGILFTPEGIFFDYETVALRRNSYANTASLSVDYALSPRSRLTFGAGHSFRDYQDNPLFRRQISDQNRYDAQIGYSREVSSHTSWNVEYRVNQYDFRDFDNARTHNPAVGLTHEFSKELRVRVLVGPSYTEALGSAESYLGYHGLIAVTKSIRENDFTLSLSRRSGTSTGLGSISDSTRIGFGLSRPLFSRTHLTVGADFYDSQGRFDNPIETRGVNGSAKLTFLLTDNLSFEIGGNYQNQNGTQPFNLDRNRVFATLRFNLPEFWRFRK